MYYIIIYSYNFDIIRIFESKITCSDNSYYLKFETEILFDLFFTIML